MKRTNFKFKGKWKIKWLTISLGFFFIGSLGFGISCANLKKDKEIKSEIIAESEIANTITKKLLEQKHLLNVFEDDVLKATQAEEVVKNSFYQEKLSKFIRLIIKNHPKIINNLLIVNKTKINFDKIGLADFKFIEDSVVTKITYSQNDKFFKSSAEIVINGFMANKKAEKDLSTKSNNFNKEIIKEIAQIINDFSPTLLNFTDFFDSNFDHNLLKDKKTLISFIEKFIRKIIVENSSSFKNVFKHDDQFFNINPNLIYVIDVSRKPFITENFVDSSDFLYVKITYDKHDLNDINAYPQIVLNGFSDLIFTDNDLD